MVSLEDPLTEDYPTRNVVEEDEQLAQILVDQYTRKPDVKARLGCGWSCVEAWYRISGAWEGAAEPGSLCLPPSPRPGRWTSPWDR